MSSPESSPGPAAAGRSAATPVVVSVLYCVLSTVWVLASDSAVRQFQLDGDGAAHAQTAKGVALVLLTGFLVYGLARREVDAFRRARETVVRSYDATLEGWTRALDMRDKATNDHTLRVTAMTVRLAADLGVQGDDLEHVRRGALLHDIGKMAVPDAILQKPGPLTADEWAVMKRHPEFARRLLEPIEFLRPALAIPVSHHERWDGTGYPDGLAGEAIPLAARIFAVVDVWDALSADRPYRRGWPPGEVREYLRARAGTEFDPRVVEAFLRIIEDSGPTTEARPGRSPHR